MSSTPRPHAEISAAASADEIRFGAAPTSRRAEQVTSKREGMDRPVRTGLTYRQVAAAIAAAARLKRRRREA